jgi:hypothetical protein
LGDGEVSVLWDGLGGVVMVLGGSEVRIGDGEYGECRLV